MTLTAIPQEAKERALWCLWKYEEREGKQTKVPYRTNGMRAASDNPETFTSFDQAVAAYQKGGYSGLGLGIFNGFCAVDIDHCIDNDAPGGSKLSGMAQDIIDTMDSYTEVSPSGTGIRILFKAKGFPYDKSKYYINNQKRGLEVYIEGATKKYVTVTGQSWNHKPIAERSEQIAAVLDKYMRRQEQKPAEQPISRLDAPVYLRRGLDADKRMRALWDGHRDTTDESGNDLALFNKLAYWCSRDEGQMIDAFLRSPYVAQKDEAHQKKARREDYLHSTAQMAIAGCQRTAADDDAEFQREREKQTFSRPAQEWTPTALPDSDGWEPPVPFDTVETPDFPTESLPGSLTAFVECLADSTQTPKEMAGILSLGILATAFQSKYEVEITPDWREPLCLYTVAIAPPGERKSAVISALTKPVYEYEAEQREFEAAEIAQNQTERAMLEKALQAAQMNATKKKANFEACKAEALELAAQLAQFKDRHPFRLLVDDTTPEKLVDIMDAQGGCITVSSAEGGLFDSLSGRYDKAANFDVYLKGHAGDPVTVDRIGRKPNHIPNPRLTMMLTIQPDVLHGLMDNATFRGRGLCGRFLYAMCKSKVGRREISPDPVPDVVKAEYRRFVRHILADNGRGVIRLSPEADRVRKDYAAYIEQKLGNEWEYMRDWGGKLVGATVRIAALMHAAEVQGNPADIPISPEVMEGAVKIAEFLGVHAMAAYQMMGADESTEDARYLWRRIESTGRDEISKRDLFDICKGKFKRMEEMEPAVLALVDMGYIREEERKTGERGRPSKNIVVNPMSKNSKNSRIAG